MNNVYNLGNCYCLSFCTFRYENCSFSISLFLYTAHPLDTAEYMYLFVKIECLQGVFMQVYHYVIHVHVDAI